MQVASGTRLGPYEIVSPLGAGGMGEVWRATDTRLDRSVAIKILPAELAQNVEFKSRFEREAKTISQLNHPHICTLYDVGHHNGTDYLVMELIEGESLADRIGRGPLPIHEVLRFGIEIAEALDKAHRQEVVHRDLKPGNVMLTRSGAKLLDFGLAKSHASGLGPRASVLETEHKPLTAEGSIVGTFQYMAPEQLEGEEADPRTDIFALGTVLYEMATGRRAFDGKTRTSLIAAIVSSQPPPISQLQPLTPPAFEHVVQRCLQKDPADRWQSAKDIAEELKWISAVGSQAGVAAPLAARRRTREQLSWALHLITAAVAAALTWGVIHARLEPPRVVTSSIVAPEKTPFLFDQGGPVLAPDGSRIAFVAQSDGKRLIWIRPLSSGAAQPLPGTEGATYPFWSADSRRLGFFTFSDLRIIEASGGPAQKIADAPAGRGGTWSRDGVILFTPTASAPLMRVSASGGAVTQVTRLDLAREEVGHRFPWFLPDGQHFVYMIDRAGPDRGEDLLAVGSLDGKTKKELFATRTNAMYASGYLLYCRDKILLAQKFNTSALALEGDATAVAQNVDAVQARAEALFSVSARGDLAYHSGASVPFSQLNWFDASGKQLAAFPKPADYRLPAVSHDGRRIAAGVVDPISGRVDVWVLDTVRNTPTRLTFEDEDEFGPIWSRDDTHLVYSVAAGGAFALAMKRSSGTGPLDQLFSRKERTVACDISPDGKTLLYECAANTGGLDLWLFSLPDRKSEPFLQTRFSESNARFSPDGRWIAYTSNESNRTEIYVQPVSGNGGKWQISADGGQSARWRRDGKQLFYLTPDDTLMAVDVDAQGDQFNASVPRPLFKASIRHLSGTQYDVSPDGSRFLINVPIEAQNVAPITLVQHWTETVGK